jgi:acetyl-CoA C-acetyltransferase
MSVNFKDKIAVVGAGCTRFAENFDMSYGDMLAEACFGAFEEAGVGPEDIDGAWLSTAFVDGSAMKGRSGMDLAEPVAIFDIPITRVSNFCASGGNAFREACLGLLAGVNDVVLAAGAEKQRDRPPQKSLVKMMVVAQHQFLQKGETAAGQFAVYATRHMEKYGTKLEHFCMVSHKNHKHGVKNPIAQYRQEIPLEAILNSPMVAYPINLLCSCPTTDGAAAVVLVRAEDAKNFNKDYVLVKAQELIVNSGWDLPFFDPRYDFSHFPSTRLAAQRAYKMAGIKDPVNEIDLAEVHDCFAPVELIVYEDLGFCKEGEGKYFIEEGRSADEGDLPVNISGGLESCGHPVGASGIRMIYEITRHLQGKAGERQVKNAKIGLAHNIGGPCAITSLTILGAP